MNTNLSVRQTLYVVSLPYFSLCYMLVLIGSNLLDCVGHCLTQYYHIIFVCVIFLFVVGLVLFNTHRTNKRRNMLYGTN